jgi:ABC-type dipeptide/oligopeptide/nickel transport system ATPase component
MHIEPAGNVVLELRHLRTHFPIGRTVFRAVEDVSFSLAQGRTLCVVGESGSGKSITARSIMRLVGPPGRIVSGEILYTPAPGAPTVDIATLDPRGRQMRALRGREIAMVFHEPDSSHRQADRRDASGPSADRPGGCG